MFKMTRIEQNGSEKRQGFSLEEMVDFADQQTGNSELNLDDVCGCWRSRELSPSLLIIGSRLGKLSTPAYVVLVNASPIEIARFERRNINS